MEHTTDLYFESHVTIDPVIDEDFDNFRLIAAANGFKVASLYMYKGKETGFVLSDLDCFCTKRDTNYDNLYSSTKKLVKRLTESGFRVRRYKLENTLLDERIVRLK